MLLLTALKNTTTLNFVKQCHICGLLRRKWTPQIKTVRTFINVNKFIRGKAQHELKITDNVSQDYQLIYRNTMKKYIVGVQIIVPISCVILGLTFSLSGGNLHTSDKSFQDWSHAIRPVENEGLIYITVFLLMAALAQALIMKLPLRIYKSSKASEYIFILPGPFPKSLKRLEVKRGEVAVSADSPYNILPWKNSSYLVQQKTRVKNVIMIDHYFRRPADLYVMLGEQKDTDLDE